MPAQQTQGVRRARKGDIVEITINNVSGTHIVKLADRTGPGNPRTVEVGEGIGRAILGLSVGETGRYQAPRLGTNEKISCQVTLVSFYTQLASGEPDPSLS